MVRRDKRKIIYAYVTNLIWTKCKRYIQLLYTLPDDDNDDDDDHDH